MACERTATLAVPPSCGAQAVMAAVSTPRPIRRRPERASVVAVGSQEKVESWRAFMTRILTDCPADGNDRQRALTKRLMCGMAACLRPHCCATSRLAGIGPKAQPGSNRSGGGSCLTVDSAGVR